MAQIRRFSSAHAFRLCVSGAALVVGALAGMLVLGGDNGQAQVVSQPAAQGNADLAVSVSKTPAKRTLLPGQSGRWIVTVENRGPDTATDVVVNLRWAVRITKFPLKRLHELFRTDGTCTGADVPSLCRTGSIPASGSVAITIIFKAPRRGSIAARIFDATVQSGTPDPNSSNNHVDRRKLGADFAMPFNAGGGRSTAERIRVKVSIDFDVLKRGIVLWSFDVFAPSGAFVTVTGAGTTERRTIGSSRRFSSAKLRGRALHLGSVITVRAEERGRIGDVLRIGMKAKGPALVGRLCVPSSGGPARHSCS